jgi:hypothetical protein
MQLETRPSCAPSAAPLLPSPGSDRLGRRPPDPLSGRPRRERESVALPLVAQPHRWRGHGDVIGFIVRTGLPDLRTVRTEANGQPAVAWYVRGTPAPKFSLELGGSSLISAGGPPEERQDRGGVVVEHLCPSEPPVAHLVEGQDG